MSDPHPLRSLRHRNERKLTLLEAWIRLGPIRVFFDASHPAVQLPADLKKDHDLWFELEEVQLFNVCIEGKIRHPRTKQVIDYSVPFDAIHSISSVELGETMAWADDITRAENREQNEGRKVKESYLS